MQGSDLAVVGTVCGVTDKQTWSILMIFVTLQCKVFSTGFLAVGWMVCESIAHFYRIVSPFLLKANEGNSLILS